MKYPHGLVCCIMYGYVLIASQLSILPFLAQKNLYLHRKKKEASPLIGPVAQRIEQLISNQLVAGSIPAGVTDYPFIINKL